MKIKRIFVLLIVVLILTGCKATVNVNIDKNSVSEDVVVRAESNSEYNQARNWIKTPLPLYYDEDLENPFGDHTEKERGVKYYSTKADPQTKRVTGHAKFSINDHMKSSLAKNCFRLYNITEDGDVKVFSTSKGLICYFTNFDIVVTTPYKVISNNAHSVNANSNTFVWHVTKANARTVSVFLQVDFSQKYNEVKKDNSNTENNTHEDKPTNTDRTTLYLVLGGIVFVIVLITFCVLMVKYKKNSGV